MACALSVQKNITPNYLRIKNRKYTTEMKNSLKKTNNRDLKRANGSDDFLSENIKSIRKKRSCLMCGSLFNSKGPHNRRCNKCDRLLKLKRKDGLKDIRVFKYMANGKNQSTNLCDY